MEKLTELAKKKTLFDDRFSEIEELSRIIEQVKFGTFFIFFHFMLSKLQSPYLG